MPYSIRTIVDVFGNSDLSLGVVVKDQGERVQVQNVANQVVRVHILMRARPNIGDKLTVRIKGTQPTILALVYTNK